MKKKKNKRSKNKLELPTNHSRLNHMAEVKLIQKNFMKHGLNPPESLETALYIPEIKELPELPRIATPSLRINPFLKERENIMKKKFRFK